MKQIFNFSDLRSYFSTSSLLTITLLFFSFISPAQIPCATAERLLSTNFFASPAGNGLAQDVTLINIPGWTGTGGGVVNAGNSATYFYDNFQIQTFTQALTNVNLKGSGAMVTVVLAAGNGNPEGLLSQINIIYNGVVYGTVATTDGTGTTASVSYANGASGNLTTMPMGAGPQTWNIYLPSGIPNNGNLQLQFAPTSASAAVASDDYNIFSVSLKSCPITFSGTVFEDANGMADGLVNGTGFNPGGLQVGLYDAAGTLIPGTATTVNSNGTYSINYVGTGTFTIRVIPATLPTGYLYTGETTNNQTGSDGTANGITATVSVTNSITNVDKSGNNFGIELPPVANNVSGSFINPGGTTTVQVPTLNGSDAEQGTFPGTGNGDTIVINTLPGSGTLYYNGTAVTPGQQINGYNPSLLTFDPPNGAGNYTFTFSEVDAAGNSSTPATGTITITAPLPVTFKDFTARAEGNYVRLDWTTGSEQNNSGFAIERSADSRNWGRIGFVASQSAGGNSSSDLSYVSYDQQPARGLNYYRILQVDLDGRSTASEVRQVVFGKDGNEISVYPNPATERLYLKVADWSAVKEVRLLDVTGRVVYQSGTGTMHSGISMQNLPKGVYLLSVTQSDHTRVQFKVLK